ncbi:uncharacterized protein LOC110893511 [Helianthus annuus]|uniref:uncharacterized protein LOC110893511 n=1 Tax=Helianthus annuus TaxID=4232 RepID=UPI000B9090C2|nr:uncharacterized protein LOC110893511 [Helianthus annuus]
MTSNSFNVSGTVGSSQNPISEQGLEDLGFQSFTERLHGDIFISSKGPSLSNVQDMRDKSSLFSKPLKIDGNPLLPRRGVVQQEPKMINIIDELEKVIVPVHEDINTADHTRGEEHVKGANTMSYADKVKNTSSKKREVNFRSLDSTETKPDADVVIPREVIRKVQEKFENVLYGYFLGNRLPYPLVEYYAKNVWAKYGFAKLMMNSEGFFFFKFDSKEGMAKILEGGPWLIRKVPLFLNVWSPSVSLKKEGIKSVPVWVKLHNVPIAIYTDDGLSLLASKLGVPKRLDGYTADMCTENWGRSSFARALIEITADKELKDQIVVAIPKLDDDGYITEIVDVEYEWKPQRCSLCCVFGHNDQVCGKNENKKAKHVVVDEEGFRMDKRKTARMGGVPMKQKQKFMYRPKVSKADPSTSGTKDGHGIKKTSDNVQVRNSFETLSKLDGRELDTEIDNREKVEKNSGKHANDNEEVVDSIPTETARFIRNDKHEKVAEGASTPGQSESHVEVANLDRVCKKVFRNWSWTSNGGLCDRGARVILGWNSDIVDVMTLSQSDQVIHAQLWSKTDNTSVFGSFVYAKNKYQDRRALWENLCGHAILCRDKPWFVMGDFNSALHMEDSLFGTSTQTIGMREFFDFVKNSDLLDVKGHGMQYTWNQKPKEGIGLLCKIDRVMCNVKGLDMFPEAYVMYRAYRVSDHTPCILKLTKEPKVSKPKPFKFANFLTSKPDFRICVEREWVKTVDGIAMFSVITKLKNLKPGLRKILIQQGNLHLKVSELRKKLDEIQRLLDKNPLDVVLRNNESDCLKEFQIAANARNKIHCIRDLAGTRYEGDEATDALVNHYASFLGTEDQVSSMDLTDICINTLSPEVASNMVRQITPEEIKNAMFSIGENKAPGPDGYTSAFFKHAWDIVGTEVTKAILEFFDNGKILKQLNHTILALIPKVETPDSVLDYHPISCCNVLYKCISKIITERLKGCLETLVSINQSAFVPGRRISDNILLTQELMHNYHLNKGPPRCAFKIDIQKAYDTVSWSFLEKILCQFGLHRKMVNWIMACVTTATYFFFG